MFWEKEKVTIISPCYNGESYIRPHIESILSQEYENLEYIFVNDGSEDSTEKIVLSYKDQFKAKNIRFIYLKQENKGQAAAINLGLQKMKGRYLSCIDADDVLLPNYVTEMSNYLKKHNDISICFPKAEEVEEKTFNHLGYRSRNLPTNVIDTFFDDMLDFHNVPMFSSYMLKTKDFLKVYPNKRIYEGKSGQNPQIILPLAYNRKVGYLDKCIFKRVVRNKSDSVGLTDKENLTKYRNWEDLYCQVLKYIPQMPEYERGYYFTKIKNMYSAKRQVIIQAIREQRKNNANN